MGMVEKKIPSFGEGEIGEPNFQFSVIRFHFIRIFAALFVLMHDRFI